jgi:hypothetical protein
MKNLFALLLILLFGATVFNNSVSANDYSNQNELLAFQDEAKNDSTATTDSTAAPAKEESEEAPKEEEKAKTTFYQMVKKYLIQMNLLV